MAENTDRRPSPDALLGLAAREGRGSLKIFLGASPGVGKTFAMLTGAQRLKAEGSDIVVGVVETHGRTETAGLLDGLEVLPQKAISYRGHTLHEFDIDRALARNPEIIIVDELAHSNAPGSRHLKRYQDVEDLLEAGIDVWTALNIQHLESLADVVASITGITVRERVPDTIVEDAENVVLIDLPPDELIERLKQGKVYLGENAARAANNFLKPGNLTALRELALRRTTQRVDDQMVDYLRQNAIEGPWPTAERLLVCIGSDDFSETVVRNAARMAQGLNGTWMAVHVSLPGSALDAVEMRRVDETLALAARLGAEVARLSAADLAGEVLRLAHAENITQIVIGRRPSGFWKGLLRSSLPDEVMKRARGVSVLIITGEEKRRKRVFKRPVLKFGELLVAPAAVSLATAAGSGLERFYELPNLSMVYLAAVLVTAVTAGTWSAIFAALLSFAAFNFFFIEPRYTLTVASPGELLSLVVFLLVAVLTGGLTGSIRQQKLLALARVKQVQNLFDLSSKLSGTVKMDDIGWIVVTQIAAIVKGQSIMLLSRGGELEIIASMPPEDQLGTADQAAARWAQERGESAGWNSGTLPNAHFRYHALRAAKGVLGVVGFRPNGDSLPAETERMIESVMDQAAVAVERTMLDAEATEAQATAQAEKLKTALLSSISHDLRTPLSSILGSASTLRSLGSKLPKAVRDDLLSNVEEEATRLSRFVTNLLDMTRLQEAGPPKDLERVDLGEVVVSAIERSRLVWPARSVSLSVAENVPAVLAKASLLEQLVFNLLDNAEKYSPPGTPTAVTVFAEGGEAVLTVEDQGPGIPHADIERIFEKFYRVETGDGRAAGTGLGLAICRAIARAFKGTIRAESPVKDNHGARFVLRLPAETQHVQATHSPR